MVRRICGDDFHNHAGFYFGIERNYSSVYFCAHHTVAHRGVNCVCKIHHRGTQRQVDNVAARGKHKHLVNGNIRLYCVDYVLHIVKLLLLFKQLAHPRQTLLKLIFALNSRLVLPVRGNTVFRGVVHIPCAYLYFKRNSFAVNAGGVQGLIHILFWCGDIIFEPVRNRTEKIMHNAKHVIAVINGVYNNAHGVYIIDFLHGFALLVYLAVYAVNAFNAPHKMKFAVFLAKALVNFIFNVVKELFLLVLLHFHAAFDVVIAHGVKHADASVLKLLHYGADTQTVRQRSINLHGFVSYAALLFHRLCIYGAHIVQTVGKLYYDYANVLCHGHKHFAHIFRLLFLF